MKKCFKCGMMLPLFDFYKHAKMGDGHLNKCKECTKFDATKHRANNLEKVQAYDRKRGSLPHRKAARLAYGRIYSIVKPGQKAANSAVANALRVGRIKREPCNKCGDVKSEAHHTNYNRPLDVVWLCTKCHHAEHRKYDYSKLVAA